MRALLLHGCVRISLLYICGEAATTTPHSSLLTPN